MKTISREELEKMIGTIQSALIGEEDLVKKAFSFLGFEFAQSLGQYWLTKPFASYKIEGDFLDALKRNSFKFDQVGDASAALTLGDSGCWKFYQDREKNDGKLDLTLKLRVAAIIGENKRGVVIKPEVSGSHASPLDFPPQFRIFKVVAEFDPAPNPIVKNIVNNGCRAVVGWNEIGLAGIRSLPRLFEEFNCGGKPGLKALAFADLSPFNPSSHKNGNLWLPEEHHMALFDVWEKQLADFKDSL